MDRLRRMLELAGRLRRGEEGQVLVLVAIMLVVLVGFTAMVVDWGRLHEERRYQQNAADAAALAGARELPDPNCPNPGSGAQRMAREYLAKNGIDPSAATITCEATFTNASDPGYDTIRVSTQRNTDMTLASIWFDNRPVAAEAKGIVGSLGYIDECMLPLAVMDSDPTDTSVPWVWGEVQTMKESASEGWSGNRGGMDLYSAQFFDVLAGRCPPKEGVYIGSDYPSQTGDWGNRFFKAIEERVGSEPCPWVPLEDYATYDPASDTWSPKGGAGTNWTELSPRFAYVPIVDKEDYLSCHGTCNLTVYGPAMFFIDFVGTENDDGSESAICSTGGKISPGKGILKGRYIKVEDLGLFTKYSVYGTKVERLWR